MTIAAITNQYKSAEENYSVDYAMPKFSKSINKNAFNNVDATYDLENAIGIHNQNSSSLNLANDSLVSNIGLFNSAQTNYNSANTTLERANQKLELLFESETTNKVALMSDSNSVAKEFAVATMAATSTAQAIGDGAITATTPETDIVNQDLSATQIKEIIQTQSDTDLKQQYEQLEKQHKLEVAQQEAERAKTNEEEQNKKLDAAQALLNNDQQTVSDKEALVQASNKEVNIKKSILIQKETEDAAPNGSLLDLEM